MDLNDPQQRAVFFRVHEGLPRQGPGSFESTRQALKMAGSLHGGPRILDIGCGPGMQTLHLARLLPAATFVVIDRHQPFIKELRVRSIADGFGERIEAMVGDMTALPFEADSFDLIWCEGAVYNMGMEAALQAWRPLLRENGRLAVNDAVWLRADPPAAVRDFWRDYPSMQDIAYNRAVPCKCGYRLLGDFVLPPSDWFEDYYDPMEERLAVLAPAYEDDEAGNAVLADCQQDRKSVV